MIRIIVVLLLLVPLAASANWMQQQTSGVAPSCINMLINGASTVNDSIVINGAASVNDTMTITCG